MEIKVKKGDPIKAKTELLAVYLFEGEKSLSVASQRIDKTLGNFVAKMLGKEKFEGKLGESLSLTIDQDQYFFHRILVLGMGEKKQFNRDKLRRVGAELATAATGSKVSRAATYLPPFGSIEPKEAARLFVQGVLLSSYRFLKYQGNEASSQAKKRLKLLEIYEDDSSVEKGVNLAETETEAVNFARDLVNEPASRVTPAFLAAEARSIARKSTCIKVKILNKNILRRLGFGGILSVSQGSDQPPFLIEMIYKGRSPKTRVALVGKGLTFDAGGLSLKSSEAMEDMKIDMAGAAAVLGVFRALVKINLPLEVYGFIPACENLPSHKAAKPGDLVSLYSGKTVEIISTDAEGRLLVAEALAYAQDKINPDKILDLATLTGAAIVALGDYIAALMTNDKSFEKELIEASLKTGEKIWPLPLEKDYDELLKSHFADLKNVAGKSAGAIQGGLFLEKFVKDTAWAHLDIAGPAHQKKGNLLNPKGGTGFGVRLILDWLAALGRN